MSLSGLAGQSFKGFLSMKKQLISLITLAVISFSSFAMPGFQSFLPDNSGEYVFYKDNSFTRESYIGLLYYNESTFQIRYYAPQDNESFLPEKDISILLTINPTAPHWEMTGERIISTILPNTEDTDIVNYLHDLMYEFSAHRIKAGAIEDRDLKIYQDYEQFGGSVIIIYDCTIPIFNIKDITNTEGIAQLKCITTGRLHDSSDTSFDDFKGFPQQNTASNTKKSKTNKSKAKTVKYSFENQRISLDSDWKQPMENLWILGNDSIVTLSSIPAYDEENEKRNEYFILRRVMESIQSAYTDFSTLTITNKNEIKISSKVYHPDRNENVCSTIILTKKKNTSEFDIFSISTYEKAWTENTPYFQKIIKSYSN